MDETPTNRIISPLTQALTLRVKGLKSHTIRVIGQALALMQNQIIRFIESNLMLTEQR